MKKYYYDPSRYKSYLEQQGITYPTVKKKRCEVLPQSAVLHLRFMLRPSGGAVRLARTRSVRHRHNCSNRI